MHYFSIFFTKFKKPRVDFLRFGRKRQFIGNFEKTFENFQNFSSENCLKCIILAYFSNKLTNYALVFCAFGRQMQIVGKFWENFEIFWWKFYRKIEIFNFLLFYYYRKFVTKNIAFGNKPVFYNNFFGFGGGGFPPFPPGYAFGMKS